MSLNFNEQSEKPRFIYRPNPLVPRAFQIFEYRAGKETYEPVGDYVLVDLSEDPDITEKKVINLVRIMNGRTGLIDFKNLTNERVLFTIVPETAGSQPDNKQKVIFRAYDGAGVSKENAVLTIEKGVFQDDNVH